MSMRWRRVGRFVQHYRAALGGIVVAGVLCLALVLLHKMLAGVHFKDVRAAIAAIGVLDQNSPRPLLLVAARGEQVLEQLPVVQLG